MASGNHVAFLYESDDAARDKAGNLRKADTHTIGALDKEVLAFILFARLIEVGIEEFACDIGHALDGAADWRAVDMDIEHAHENRDTRHRLVAQSRRASKLDRWHHGLDQGHETVGWSHDETVINGGCPGRIAEKCQRPDGDTRHRPGKRFPSHEGENRGYSSGDQSELASFRMNRRERPFCDPGAPVCQFLFCHASAF